MASPPVTVGTICVVGPGDQFLSGMSQYTYRLATALDEDHNVSVILLRHLLPRRLYPGSSRVGQRLSERNWPRRLHRFEGLDWFWLPSLPRALAFLNRERPDALVLQWWTGTVAHTYLALAAWGRRHGVPVVLEFHEVQDPGEAEHRHAAAYTKVLMRRLLRNVSAAVVHSQSDRAALDQAFGLASLPVAVIPHGPYDHLAPAPRDDELAGQKGLRLLSFGLIRPYKGVDVLLRLFNELSAADVRDVELRVVGEVWENHHEPARLIACSPHRQQITFLPGYVPDREVPSHFAAADAVVLPYRRMSSSGPLSIAVSAGLPVLVSDIPAMRQALDGYPGAVYCSFQTPEDLRQGISELRLLAGRRFATHRSWSASREGYRRLLGELHDRSATPVPAYPEGA